MWPRRAATAPERAHGGTIWREVSAQAQAQAQAPKDAGGGVERGAGAQCWGIRTWSPPPQSIISCSLSLVKLWPPVNHAPSMSATHEKS